MALRFIGNGLGGSKEPAAPTQAGGCQLKAIKQYSNHPRQWYAHGHTLVAGRHQSTHTCVCCKLRQGDICD